MSDAGASDAGPGVRQCLAGVIAPGAVHSCLTGAGMFVDCQECRRCASGSTVHVATSSGSTSAWLKATRTSELGSSSFQKRRRVSSEGERQGQLATPVRYLSAQAGAVQ